MHLWAFQIELFFFVIHYTLFYNQVELLRHGTYVPGVYGLFLGLYSAMLITDWS